MTTDRHRALASESRVRILEVLRSAGEALDAHAVASAVGLHVNTARAHLDMLADAGLTTRRPESRDRPGRPRIVYEAEADPSSQDGEGYRFLAEILTSYLEGTVADPAAAAEAAGRAWGDHLVERPRPFSQVAPAETLVQLQRLFDRLGFAPDLGDEQDGELDLNLRRCPFLDLALDRREVVCGVHLGLLRGALSALGAPYDARQLDPLVQPGLCVAHLRRQDEA